MFNCWWRGKTAFSLCA